MRYQISVISAFSLCNNHIQRETVYSYHMDWTNQVTSFCSLPPQTMSGRCCVSLFNSGQECYIFYAPSTPIGAWIQIVGTEVGVRWSSVERRLTRWLWNIHFLSFFLSVVFPKHMSDPVLGRDGVTTEQLHQGNYKIPTSVCKYLKKLIWQNNLFMKMATILSDIFP